MYVCIIKNNTETGETKTLPPMTLIRYWLPKMSSLTKQGRGSFRDQVPTYWFSRKIKAQNALRGAFRKQRIVSLRAARAWSTVTVACAHVEQEDKGRSRIKFAHVLQTAWKHKKTTNFVLYVSPSSVWCHHSWSDLSANRMTLTIGLTNERDTWLSLKTCYQQNLKQILQ